MIKGDWFEGWIYSAPPFQMKGFNILILTLTVVHSIIVPGQEVNDPTPPPIPKTTQELRETTMPPSIQPSIQLMFPQEHSRSPREGCKYKMHELIGGWFSVWPAILLALSCVFLVVMALGLAGHLLIGRPEERPIVVKVRS